MLKSFRHEPKNKPFVTETFNRYIGQGLCNAGYIRVEGRNHNKYVMKVLHNDKIRTVIFRESDIENWKLSGIGENDDTYYDALECIFTGILDGKSYNFRNYDCDDYDHIFVRPFHFELKVQDISICDHDKFEDGCVNCKEFETQYKKFKEKHAGQPTYLSLHVVYLSILVAPTFFQMK